MEEMDELMLPGFRFHPTDEELVGFYLKRKVQRKPFSVELIKQLDIYKYDPWDLPKLAATGEKEWYFYCPRDRKYRNSPRPNRVTQAGFWKATGTDRPVYASGGSKPCIGLKKSLVFYRGRAAKGIKTDWMMHEFRLPSSLEDSKRYLDKCIPAYEAWAICRIFKKVNSSIQRANTLISQSWIPPTLSSRNPNPNFETIRSSDHLCSFSTITMEDTAPLSLAVAPPHLISSPYVGCGSNDHQTLTQRDASSLLLDMSSSMLGDSCKGSDVDGAEFSMLSKMMMHENLGQHELNPVMGLSHFGLPTEAWKWNLLWDSSPCLSELPTSFSTNKCYS